MTGATAQLPMHLPMDGRTRSLISVSWSAGVGDVRRLGSVPIYKIGLSTGESSNESSNGRSDSGGGECGLEIVGYLGG